MQSGGDRLLFTRALQSLLKVHHVNYSYFMGRGVLGDLHLVVGVQVLHNLHLLNVLGLAGTLGGCVAAGASTRSSAFRIPSPVAALPAIKAGVLPRGFQQWLGVSGHEHGHIHGPCGPRQAWPWPSAW